LATEEQDLYALWFCQSENLEWIWARSDQAIGFDGHPLIPIGSAIHLDPLHLFGSITAGYLSDRSLALPAILTVESCFDFPARPTAISDWGFFRSSIFSQSCFSTASKTVSPPRIVMCTHPRRVVNDACVHLRDTARMLF